MGDVHTVVMTTSQELIYAQHVTLTPLTLLVQKVADGKTTTQEYELSGQVTVVIDTNTYNNGGVEWCHYHYVAPFSGIGKQQHP